MDDLTDEGVAKLIVELDQTLDEIYQLAGSLGLVISPDGEYRKLPERENSTVHRNRARMALAQVKVRDIVEAIASSEKARAIEPANLAEALERLASIYDLLGLIDDSRTYFDAIRPLLKSQDSLWELGSVANMLVIGYIDCDRLDEGADLYLGMLSLGPSEELGHGMARAAFNLISRLAELERMDRAEEIFATMEMWGGKASLTLVKEGGPDAPHGPPQPPRTKPALTLLNRQGGEREPGPERQPPMDSDYDDDAGIIRAQAAVNIVSGYAVTGQPDKAYEIYRSMPELWDDDEEYVALKSMAAVNMIRVLIQVGRWNEAFHIFREMLLLNRLADTAVLVAKGAVELIGFADQKHIPEAEYAYAALANLGQGEEFLLERSRACGNLIYIYGDFKQLDKARELYDSMGKFGDSLDFLAVRAKATVNLMNDYCVAKMLPQAEELFEILNGFGDHDCLAPSKLQAAHNLMIGYFRANLFRKAESLYRSMAKFGNSQHISAFRARSAFGLLAYYVNANNLEKALEIYATFDELAVSEEALIEKGKALVNLVNFVGGLGLTTLARKHYLAFYDVATDFLRSTKEDDAYDEPGAYELGQEGLEPPIGGFAEVVGHYYKMDSEIDQDYIDENLDLDLYSLLCKAAFNLILDYVKLDDFGQAEAMYQTMLNLDSLGNPNVAQDTAQAGCVIISEAITLGKWPITMRILENMKTLPDTQPVNHQKCLAAINILNYNIPRKLSITRTVYEFLSETHPSGPDGFYLARAAQDMVIALVRDKQYQEALEIYNSMAKLGNYARIIEKRASAASFLMQAYESLGWLAEAKKIYNDLSGMGNKPKVAKHRLRAAKMLAKLMRKSGLIEAAAQLSDETRGLINQKMAPSIVHGRPEGEKG
jgi:pentatricopeptide repeat protein